MRFPLMLLLPVMAWAGEAVIAVPRGVFPSAGTREQAVVGHPQVRGGLVRVFWSEIEPSPDRLVLDRIRAETALLRAAGKGWSLAVVAGPHAPSWLYEKGAAAVSITFRGEPTRVPRAGDRVVEERLAALASALGTALRDDAALRLVYLPQMSANGIEGHFNGNAAAALAAQGLTPAVWAEATVRAAHAFAAAFPAKPVAIELHEVLGGMEAPRRIMAGIEADPGLLRQVGIAVWWLSGRTDYQGELLQAVARFRGAKYAQLIDRADRTGSFPGGDYAAAVAQARTLGIRYLEPWEVDLKSGRWDALFEGFNRWADTGP